MGAKEWSDVVLMAPDIECGARVVGAKEWSDVVLMAPDMECVARVVRAEGTVCRENFCDTLESPSEMARGENPSVVSSGVSYSHPLR